MGKYTRKPTTSGDVAAVPAAQPSLGVRTRARTLALQRQPDYLELRSRRLEKPPLLWQYLQNSRKAAGRRREFACGDEEGTRIEKPKEEEDCFGGEAAGDFEIRDLEIEVSLGENNLDIEVRDRGTRESTPCSLIGSTDDITTPGSSTKQRSPVANRRVQNVLRNTPTAREIEEFFSCADKLQQSHFIEKYNFDIVNDLPLPGRYEWIRVTTP